MTYLNCIFFLLFKKNKYATLIIHEYPPKAVSSSMTPKQRGHNIKNLVNA